MQDMSKDLYGNMWPLQRIENHTIFLRYHRTHGDNKQNQEATNSKPTRIGDDLPQVLWIHRILLKNNQKETPFSLIYGSKAIILTVKSNVAKDDKGRTNEVTKRKESKEVASIEEAYYQNEPH
nr:hypothetical protein [Tanacetum cinerariifolium]